MSGRHIVFFAGLLAIAGAGCAIDEQGAEVNQSSTSLTVSTLPSTTPPSAAPDSSPVEPAVPEVFDWTAPLVGGGLINLAGYSDRAVVLWFWAPY
jgi:hypothetical protein